jgi:hypothetical protein
MRAGRKGYSNDDVEDSVQVGLKLERADILVEEGH